MVGKSPKHKTEATSFECASREPEEQVVPYASPTSKQPKNTYSKPDTPICCSCQNTSASSAKELLYGFKSSRKAYLLTLVKCGCVPMSTAKFRSQMVNIIFIVYQSTGENRFASLTGTCSNLHPTVDCSPISRRCITHRWGSCRHVQAYNSYRVHPPLRKRWINARVF